MKKMNNKGFAVSTVLYSLLIMVTLVVTLLISHMSNNRINSSTLVKKIEDELNRFSNTATEFSQNAEEGQEFIVPYGKAGWYKIELWGAAGAGAASSSEDGNGAYTSGIVYLEENDYLYFYIGKQASSSSTSGGFNGGGGAAANGRGGGGATDVRLENGGVNDTTSLRSRIMVAAGGAGKNSSGTAGGAGGTLVGKKEDGTPGSATQTSGNQFGIGATATGNNGGGGGGYYGGAVNQGGSSYIAGYAGVNSIASDGTHTGKLIHEHYDEDNEMMRYFYFINGFMVAGVNSGNGKARIELISQNDINNPPTKKTEKLNKIVKVEDCINGESSTTSNKWLEIQAVSEGVNVAAEGTVSTVTGGANVIDGSVSNTTYATADGNTCVSITFKDNAAYNLDEIAVWHDFSTNKRYKNHIVKAYAQDGTVHTIKASAGELDEHETAAGFHYTAWQYDTDKELPTGNYYIFSTLTENGAVTCSAASDKNISVTPFMATLSQKWHVEKVTTGAYAGNYKLVETENQGAMQNVWGNPENIVEDSENVVATTKFENHAWELWKLAPNGDGTYTLRTPLNNAFYLSTQLSTINSYSNIYLKNTTPTFNQRFKFIPAEY